MEYVEVLSHLKLSNFSIFPTTLMPQNSFNRFIDQQLINRIFVFPTGSPEISPGFYLCGTTCTVQGGPEGRKGRNDLEIRHFREFFGK